MKQRILVISNTIDAGGAETFVMKVFRNLNKEQLCFDFLINKKESNFYLDEIHKLGGEVYYGYPKSKHPLKSFKSVYRTVKDGGYLCVLSLTVHPLGFLDLVAAKWAGARIRLTRSTNSNSGRKASAIAASVCRPLVRAFSTVMLAPSKEAAEWLFGKRVVAENKVHIITNGIDVEKYHYNENKRNVVRCNLGLDDDTLVIGHVGRFNKQKNHEKLIDIFAKIKGEKTNSCLLLIGEGHLQQSIQNQAESLEVTESVRFLGIREDVPDLLMAMDVFVFPSLYEGMPNAVIEAQATGLPCVISDTISKDVGITDCVSFVSLSGSSGEWAKVAIAEAKKTRKDMCEEIIEKGYSIEETTRYLTECFEID